MTNRKTNHRNRGRITLEPLDSIPWVMRTMLCERLQRTAPQWEPVAKVQPGGLLVRHRETGRLMEWLGDSLASIQEAKAHAALEHALRTINSDPAPGTEAADEMWRTLEWLV